MPVAEYETRTDSVLAWKKAQKLGRFDPDAPSIEQQKILASEREVDERGKQHVPVSLSVCPHTPNTLANHLGRSQKQVRSIPLGMSDIAVEHHQGQRQVR